MSETSSPAKNVSRSPSPARSPSPLGKRKTYLAENNRDSDDKPSPTRTNRIKPNISSLRKVARTTDFGLADSVPDVRSIIKHQTNESDQPRPTDSAEQPENKEEEEEHKEQKEQKPTSPKTKKTKKPKEKKNIEKKVEIVEESSSEEEEEDISNMTLGEIVTLCTKTPKSKKYKRRGKTETKAEDAEIEGTIDTVEKKESQVRDVEETEEANDRPKIQLIDGKLVVNEESLVQKAPEFEREVVTRTEKIVLNQNAFRKRALRKKVTWHKENTKLFYKALRIFGPNLTNMNMVLTHITRQQIRSKLKKEEKENPHLIEFAIKNRVVISDEELHNYLNPKAAEESQTKIKKGTKVKDSEGDEEDIDDGPITIDGTSVIASGGSATTPQSSPICLEDIMD